MLDTSDFYSELIAQGIEFFCGVPDSLLKDFCSCLQENCPEEKNIITANEGNALGLAAGYHLTSRKVALLYLQNSGLGNIINPLLSLVDSKVYNIPVLLLIGWRGEPGISDEPQHIRQGELTLPLLKTMGIPYEILIDCSQVKTAVQYIKKTNLPFALVVKKGTFSPYVYTPLISENDLSREEAIKEVLSLISKKDVIVSTTGMISREVYENTSYHNNCFFTVGSMGHASSIAFGIALTKQDRNIFCLDGDGALMMHMGALPVITSRQPKNFKHIIFNNHAHDSVGGQPTASSHISLTTCATALGYKHVFQAKTLADIKSVWPTFYTANGPCLLEIKVRCGARKNLGRPKETPQKNKALFMKFLEE